MDCRAPGLSESESCEITHVSSDAPVDEEEGLDLDLIYDRLESMKQRLLYLRSLLVCVNTGRASNGKGPCEQHIEGNGSINLELRQLQKAAARMAQEMNALMKSYMSSRKDYTDLSARVEHQKKEVQKLEQDLGQVPKWQEETQHKHGLCIERYNDLRIHCLTSNQVLGCFSEMQRDFSNKVQFKTSIRCFKKDKHEFIEKWRELKCLRRNMTTRLLLHVNKVEKSVEEQTRLRSYRPNTCMSKESVTSFILSFLTDDMGRQIPKIKGILKLDLDIQTKGEDDGDDAAKTLKPNHS
ncbi:uncharacterized protein LOC115623034 [Scaptodrosophila lebanonensis]|uniref:Uncharacterized protein LOC115623034 n=1 Tax=Drosophila lebanonensis TaxID=7225 RepID=A0A6J2T807_DROLE|nr:uncharacterized protein LOC115623034 [Scaptodrosophila lebanonensis]